jgi:hypothetical protein
VHHDVGRDRNVNHDDAVASTRFFSNSAIQYAGGFVARVVLGVAPCPAGRHSFSDPGDTPCDVCPAGSACAGATVQPLACPMGTYSTEGSGVCSLCPEGRYGSSENTPDASCSGPCAATAGWGCPEGSTSRHGAVCPAGRHNSVTTHQACKLCPSGTFGNTEGLRTSSCTGTCMGAPGRGCSPGSTDPTGVPCPVGTESVQTTDSQWRCVPCSAGRYGVLSLGVAVCTGNCVPADLDHTCGVGETAATGSRCPAGKFSALDGSGCSVTAVCGKGRYYSGNGVCRSCPVGRYGSQDRGLTSPLCSGSCLNSPG